MWLGSWGRSFFGEVALDGVDEDEFFAAGSDVIEPAPFELTIVAEAVDFLDAAGNEFRGFGNTDPGGRTGHAEADFAVDGRRYHFDEPDLLEDGGRLGRVKVGGFLSGRAHGRSRNQQRCRYGSGVTW